MKKRLRSIPQKLSPTIEIKISTKTWKIVILFKWFIFRKFDLAMVMALAFLSHSRYWIIKVGLVFLICAIILRLKKNKYCYCSVKLQVCASSSPSFFFSSSSFPSSSSYACTSSFFAVSYTCRSIISHNICFCRMFDIFSKDRPTN